MSTVTTQAAKPSRRLWYIIGGCVILLLFGCLLAAAVGGYFYLRNRPTSQQPTVEYILDSSPRMSQETQGGARIDVARGVLAEIVRPANPDLTSGLRVFGSGAVSTSCQDTKLIVPFAQSNQGQIADQLDSVQVGSDSDSPLSEAMIAAIKDMASTKGPHSLVVVTGGPDSCNPQAAELIKQEAQRAGIDLQTYVVGFQVAAGDAEAVKALAEAMPGGTYTEADNAEQLRTVLTQIQAKINNPSPPTTSSSSGATACDHPYMPLRTGATWNYSGSDSPFSWKVDSVSGDKNNATAHITIDFGAGTMALDWTCSRSGILYYTLGGLSIPGSGEIMNFQLQSQDGVSIPSAEQLTSGASWDTSYVIATSMNIPGISGQSFNSTFNETSQAGASTSVTTSAGTFQAIPVTSTGTVSSDNPLAPFTVDIQTTIYLAKGVGIVKMESTAAGSSTNLELSSYSIP